MFQALGVEDIENIEVVEHIFATYLGVAHPGIPGPDFELGSFLLRYGLNSSISPLQYQLLLIMVSDARGFCVLKMAYQRCRY
jgi:hypothetical protein